MAHGAPDWWTRSRIDIIAQALAYLKARPVYGEAKLEFGEKTIAANTVETLFSINGRGMTYGGIIYTIEGGNAENDKVSLYVDGTGIASMSFNTLKDLGLTRPNDWVMWVSTFNPDSWYWCMCIRYGITFDSQLRMVYDRNHDTNVKVNYKMVYALLE